MTSKIDQIEHRLAASELVWKLAAINEPWAQCGSAWEFLKNFVITHDAHDKAHPDKLYPDKLMYRVIVRAWIEYDVLFIEKARQLMLSWTMCALSEWDTIFHKNRWHCLQSREIEAASALNGRVLHIHDNLESRGFQDLPKMGRIAKDTAAPKRIRFPKNKSVIMAAPQGRDVFRSYTFSVVFADEVAFQPEAEEGYTAAIPSVSGGGKYFAVSTPNGKVFNYRKMYGINDKNRPEGRRIVDSNKVHEKRYTEEQLLKMGHREFYSIPFEELVACVPGMRFWIMKLGDEITPCLRVHYSADPDRRPGTPAGEAWFKAERPKYSDSKWAREQEISYTTFEGRWVVQNWNPAIFAPENPDFDYDPRETLYVSVDFGARVACAIFAQKIKIPDYNFWQIRIIDEIVLRDSNTMALAAEIRKKLECEYIESWQVRNFRVFCDIAGMARSAEADKSLQTSIDIMRYNGLFPFSKKFSIKESTELVETIFATTSPNGKPGVQVHNRCDYAISCYEGGWHYPDKDTGDGKPEKDGEYDHGGDTTRYLFGNLFNISDYVTKESAAKVQRIIPVRAKYTGRIVRYRRVPAGRIRRTA